MKCLEVAIGVRVFVRVSHQALTEAFLIGIMSLEWHKMMCDGCVNGPTVFNATNVEALVDGARSDAI